MRHALLAAALLSGTAACIHAPLLMPAPTVPTLSGHPDAAVAEGYGVQLVLMTRAWDGSPSDLPWVVTPADLAVENHSGHPLRVRYKDFSLKAANGFQTTAIPPFRIQRPGTRTVISPYFPGVGFAVAPPYAGYYPGYVPWVGPFDVDPSYYDYYSIWTQPLPSPDMLARGLPEGVLNDGGHVRGFLYFNRVPAAPVAYNFNVDLIDANTGVKFGNIAVPLVVKPY